MRRMGWISCSVRGLGPAVLAAAGIEGLTTKLTKNTKGAAKRQAG